MSERLSIALISDTFHTQDGPSRLLARLREAREGGASVAVLPELSCNRWCPATRDPSEADQEPPGGPLAQMQAEAAAEAGIWLVGGSLIRDEDGIRRNSALVFDDQGTLKHRYSKIHIPDEPGFWEADHYQADDEIPRPLEIAGIPMGIQICSDINRPGGTHILAAQGAEVILGPRSTEQITYEKWQPVFRANALTGSCYVLSVNRPVPEDGVLIGGPSIAVAPNGEVLLETTDPVAIVTIDRAVVHKARGDYPGYLAIPSDLYARAWASIPPRQAHGPLGDMTDATHS
ncbi:MAG: carbon-nitrogen hydrolase family protein [Planctomycetota bacterium]|nr:carbon-nitrogen hydrolase family protein [Planctomycetota bacterium]